MGASGQCRHVGPSTAYSEGFVIGIEGFVVAALIEKDNDNLNNGLYAVSLLPLLMCIRLLPPPASWGSQPPASLASDLVGNTQPILPPSGIASLHLLLASSFP